MDASPNDKQNPRRQRRFGVNPVIPLRSLSRLAEALQKYLFRREAGLTETLLNLSERKHELSIPGGPSYGSICEDTFELEQLSILRDQIDIYLTPALNHLFTQPRPYSEMIARFRKRFATLEERINANIAGAKQFKENVLFQFRRARETDPVPVQDAEQEFESDLEPEPGDDIFFRNVFQQAWIRAWGEFCKALVKRFELTPKRIAECLVRGGDVLCFDSKVRMFEASPSHPYLQNQLYRNDRIIVSDQARLQCCDLIIGTFANKKARKAFTEQLPNEVEEPMVELASLAICRYAERMRRQNRDHIKKNWRFDESLDTQTRMYLGSRDSSSDPGEKKEFADKLDELATERTLAAETILSNVLGVPPELLRADESTTESDAVDESA
jgi:hypothetical protein